MNKKKIYWWIQQINEMSGTEMTSINTMNNLANNFDITLFVSTKINDDFPYQINPNIKVVNLNFKPEVIRFDYYCKLYFKNKHFLKAIKTIFNTFFTVLFKRFSIRKKIKQIIDKDSILISSSLDSYIFAPKVSKLYFHYHFSDKVFVSFSESFFRLFAKKPNKYIFLLDDFANNIIKRKPHLKNKIVAINNPCRYEPIFKTSNHKNKIIFIGRLMEQKNPFLALHIAKELKKYINFVLDIYGEGPLDKKMQLYINSNKLGDCVYIHKPVKDINEKILESDLLLMTSKYEGLPLVIRECLALSCPCVVPNLDTGISNLIINEENGFAISGYNVSDYVNAIKVILDAKNIDKFKESAYLTAKKYSNELIFDKWIKLLA